MTQVITHAKLRLAALLEWSVVRLIKIRWLVGRRWRKLGSPAKPLPLRIDYDFKGIGRVDMRMLRPGEVMVIRTLNSIYQIAVAPSGPPDAVAYTNSSRFPEPRRVRLNGSVPDPHEASIYAGMLVRGLHLELWLNEHDRIWTSPIKHISISGLNVFDELTARDLQTDAKTGTLNLH